MVGHPVLLRGGERDGQVHPLGQEDGVLEFRADEHEDSPFADADYLLTEETVQLPDGQTAQVAVLQQEMDR
jgi:hypothetical protein